MGRPKKGVTTEDRFWANVRKTRGCWLWLGAKHRSVGYGKLNVAGQHVLAHRFAFKLSRGFWPNDNVLHTCDNTMCVKFDHLYDGSQKQNTHDWLTRKGRKLTARQALWCKGKSVQKIMAKFKVFWTHAYALRRGAYWRWA